MISFPYLRDRFSVPSFFIDVPYEKSEDAVRDVAGQLERLTAFIGDVTGEVITREAVAENVRRSRISGEQYRRYLAMVLISRLENSVGYSVLAI